MMTCMLTMFTGELVQIRFGRERTGVLQYVHTNSRKHLVLENEGGYIPVIVGKITQATWTWNNVFYL